MKFEEMTVGAFIDELASNSPAPGGGSVAALCGALASALAVMVGNLTIGKQKYQDGWESAENAISEGEKLKSKFINLMNKDTDSFNLFMAAMKMSKTTEAEKIIRAEAIENAAKIATETPLTTLETCVSLMDAVELMAAHGNPNAVSDAGVAALLAESAGRAAAYNVMINLPGIKDRDFSDKCRERMNAALEIIGRRSSKVAAIIGNSLK